jgi:hypothetical protein
VFIYHHCLMGNDLIFQFTQLQLCIVLLSLHDMFQPVMLGHLQVDCVQEHILRHCIFALCVNHVKENKISVLMNFLTHGI